MKKLLALLLTLALSVSMVACSSAPASSESTEGGESTSTETTEDGESTSTEASLTIKEGVLQVALSPDFAPMEFVDLSKTGDDQFVGFDVTLAKHIASEMGLELKICPMSFDACQAAVSTGKVDMSISGFSWTETRAENYNLSDYYQAGDNETEQVTITLAANADKFTTAADYAGIKVGAQTASLQEELCKSQLTGCEVVAVGDINTGILQLKTGDFEAMAVADGNADAIIAANPDVVKTGFKFEVDPKYTDNLILLQKGDDDLTAEVNAILAKAKAAGLYEGWYNDALDLAGVDTSADVSFDDDGNVIE